MAEAAEQIDAVKVTFHYSQFIALRCAALHSPFTVVALCAPHALSARGPRAARGLYRLTVMIAHFASRTLLVVC